MAEVTLTTWGLSVMTAYDILSVPPKPTSIDQELVTHDSTKVNWTVTDFSDSASMAFAGKKLNITTYLYINGHLMHKIKDVSLPFFILYNFISNFQIIFRSFFLCGQKICHTTLCFFKPISHF